MILARISDTQIKAGGDDSGREQAARNLRTAALLLFAFGFVLPPATILRFSRNLFSPLGGMHPAFSGAE